MTQILEQTPEEEDEEEPGAAALPAGVRNYITPHGFETIKTTLLPIN